MVNHFHIDTHIKPPNTRQNSILRFQLLSANGTVVSTSHLLPISLKRTVEVVPRPGIRVFAYKNTFPTKQILYIKTPFQNLDFDHQSHLHREPKRGSAQVGRPVSGDFRLHYAKPRSHQRVSSFAKWFHATRLDG